MRIRILMLFVLALLLCVTPSRAASSSNCDATVGDGSPWSITCHFTPGPSGSATFDFGPQGDGTMTMQFETVLTTFDVTLTANEFAVIPNPLDPNEFPSGTVCITYFNGHCVRYDFSGNAVPGGLDGVPVKGVDYRGLITLTLNYNRSSSQPVQIPAFAHAPGENSDSTTFSEDILTSYVDTDSNCPSCIDPAMGGKTPGISPFAALYKPLPTAPSVVCSLTAAYQTSASDQNPIVEVSFKLVASGGDCTNGPFLRDKTASLSVALNGNPPSFADLINGGDSNKFHFDNKNKTNVQDINTNKLPQGSYIVTVRSSLFAPVRTPSFNVPNTP
jgi:hypothetical protein